MTHIKAIGGIFIRSKNPEALKGWYQDILDLNFDDYLASVLPVTKQDAETGAYSVLGLFPDDTEYFSPSQENVMINFRVENLPGLIEELEKKGVPVTGPEKFEQGLFAWIIDPEGRKIELWEMP